MSDDGDHGLQASDPGALLVCRPSELRVGDVAFDWPYHGANLVISRSLSFDCSYEVEVARARGDSYLDDDVEVHHFDIINTQRECRPRCLKWVYEIESRYQGRREMQVSYVHFNRCD